MGVWIRVRSILARLPAGSVTQHLHHRLYTEGSVEWPATGFETQASVMSADRSIRLPSATAKGLARFQGAHRKVSIRETKGQKRSVALRTADLESKPVKRAGPAWKASRTRKSV